MKKIFFLAVNTAMTKHNEITERYIKFYDERASEKLYCSIVGNVVIPNGYPTNLNTPIISNNKLWKELATRINSKGTRPGIQLASTWSTYEGQRNFISRENSLETYKSYMEGINERTIQSIFSNLYLASRMSIDFGFKHIQLHAGHGYLFNLLIEPVFTSFHDLIMEKLVDWLFFLKKNNIESSIRVSLVTGNLDIDKALEVSNLIPKLSPDYYDLSDGFYNIDKKLIYPYSKNIECRKNRQIDISNTYIQQKFISSGLSYGLYDEEILPDNLHIGICRDLIASPNFLNFPNEKGCSKCSKCHYYSRGKSELECPQWDEEY